MKMNIRGSKVKITSAINDYIENKIGKLDKYLENPNDLTSIIFICNEKIDARKKITKLMKEKYEIITIPNLRYYEIENRIDIF